MHRFFAAAQNDGGGLIFGEHDGVVLSAAAFIGIIGGGACEFIFRGIEVEQLAFHSLGKTFKLRFAVDVGGSLQIEAAHSGESVLDMDIDFCVVNRCAAR